MARTSFVTFLPSVERSAGAETYSGEFNLYDHDEILIFLNASAVGGTLDVKVQTKDPSGEWYDLATFSQLSAAGKEAKAITVFGETLRIAYTVGTSPATFEVTAIAKARN